MNLRPDKQTTLTNTVLVGGYTGLASGAVYMADKRLELNLDSVETAFLVTAVSAVVTFIWNKLKDRGIVTDNRA